VTDANVVLERLDPNRSIAGDGQTLDVQGARAAVGKLGEKLGLGVEETAEAILAIINQRMAGRIRLLSIEQGHDPRDFAFVAFGGAGPLHGAALIRDVGIKSMLVPQYPGVLCAMGCALADLRIDLSQTLEENLAELPAGTVGEILARQAEAGRQQLGESGIAVESVELRHAADMAYRGQIHNLRVEIEPDWTAEQIGAAFDRVYAQEFGSALENTARRIVNLRTAVIGRRGDRLTLRRQELRPHQPQPVRVRRVHFGGWLDTPIYDRKDLTPGAHFTGPAVVEQSDTTTVIEPGMTARVDAWGNLIVELA
jgi:N-methylhydantoinase A